MTVLRTERPLTLKDRFTKGSLRQKTIRLNGDKTCAKGFLGRFGMISVCHN